MNTSKKIWLEWARVTSRLSRIPAPDINLFGRLYIAQIFFMSGRTKVVAADDEGFWQAIVAFLTPADHAISLFREEYALPILPPEFAAQIALLAETFLPIFLILGIATRLSALSLLAMTGVIQVFVYPGLWMEHLLWATILSMLVLRGGGKISADHLIVEYFTTDT